MKRSIITVVVLGLLPGCAAVQVPHRSPSPGRSAGLPIGLAEIMNDTSGIFDSIAPSDDITDLSGEAELFRLKISLAVADPISAIDDITTIASVNNGYVADSDTSMLTLCVPTGAIKSVLSGIGALGDITKFACAAGEPVGEAAGNVRKLDKVIRSGDFIMHLMAGTESFYSFGWIEDGAVRQIEMMREIMKLSPGQHRFTGIDISLIVIQPKRPGIGDYMIYLVKGVNDLLRR